MNLYSTFAEFFAETVRRHGRYGCIMPTGIATDDSNKHFFGWLVRSGRLATLFDFENREGLFPSVDSRVKFALLTGTGSDRPAAPFNVAFFLTQPEQLRDPDRRFTLSAAEIALFNPNTRTCPIFRSKRDALITERLYKAAPVLIREDDPTGNPWGVSLRQGLFNMTSDSGLFRTWDEMIEQGFTLADGAHFRKSGETYLPLYEAKLIHQFDHRFATYERVANGDTTRDVTEAEHANPACPVLPRYWVAERDVEEALGVSRRQHSGWFVGFRGITNATNERTAIFSIVPWVGAGNSLPLMDFSSPSTSHLCGLVANTSSFAFDFVARQKTGGSNFNLFIVKQLPILPPYIYTPELLDLIVPRVLELVYTAHDLAPFARDCGYDGPPFTWDEERRAQLRADLDGIYAHLYGLSRDNFAYILDTFPIVARKDEAKWGEYRTKRLCLEAYDRFAGIVGGAVGSSDGRAVG